MCDYETIKVNVLKWTQLYLPNLIPVMCMNFIKNKNSLFNQISIYATLVVRQENWLKIEHVYICMIGNNSTNNAEFDLIRNGWNWLKVNYKSEKTKIK